KADPASSSPSTAAMEASTAAIREPWPGVYCGSAESQRWTSAARIRALGRDVIARQSAKARSMISSSVAVGQPAGSSPKRPMLILTSAVPERMCALVHGHLFDTNVEAL